MIILASTSDLLRVITSNTADVEVHSSWVDNASGTITVGRTNPASITTATTTTLVSSPGASTQRNVRHCSLRNNDPSNNADVIVDHTDGTNAETLVRASLLPGESLVLDERGEWHHYDMFGGEYSTRTDIMNGDRIRMVSGSDLTSLVTGGAQHFHPGHPKVWCKAGVAGNALASYNMTSVTDTGAGRATFNFNTDFSNAACFALVADIERTSTTLSATNVKFCNIRFATMLAGSTGVEVYDFTTTTAVQEDPTAYHILGLGDIV